MLRDQEIEEAYVNAAKLVQLYGEKYLLVFERLSTEMQSIERRRKLYKVALEAITTS